MRSSDASGAIHRLYTEPRVRRVRGVRRGAAEHGGGERFPRRAAGPEEVRAGGAAMALQAEAGREVRAAAASAEAIVKEEALSGSL
jgi:hypothetical protein